MFLLTVAGIGDHDVTEEGFIVIISSLIYCYYLISEARIICLTQDDGDRGRGQGEDGQELGTAASDNLRS